jgi:hypothetical protein
VLYVYSGNVKSERTEQFHEWVQHAERRFASTAPKGWSFKGIYLAAFGFGPAQAEIHWEVDHYAAFDSAVDAQRSGGEYAKVVAEFFSHVDPSSQNARLLRSVADKNLTLVKGVATLAL